jgi:hypothetical protein
MKLYTEEQIRYFFECGRNYQNNAEITFRVARDEMPTKPIELPSDDEIEEKINNDIFIESDEDFFNGAIWMRSKIQEKINKTPNK